MSTVGEVRQLTVKWNTETGHLGLILGKDAEQSKRISNEETKEILERILEGFENGR